MSKKTYQAPTLDVFGSMQEITKGIFGDAPDVPPFQNINCTTALIGNTLLSCATGVQIIS